MVRQRTAKQKKQMIATNTDGNNNNIASQFITSKIKQAQQRSGTTSNKTEQWQTISLKKLWKI